MTRYLCLKASEFEDLLMLFADNVAAKVWNKMPYDKWKRLLKKLDSKDYPFVGIDFGKTEVLTTFIDHDGNAYEYDDTQNFHKGDKSFGDFLFREYAHLLEDDTMTASASSAISTAKTSVDGLTGTVSNSWSNINADYSTSIADAIS